MPIRIDLSPDSTRANGVDVTWVPTRSSLDIRIWDDYTAIIGVTSIRLSEFLQRLKISERDCARAFAQIKRRNAT